LGIVGEIVGEEGSILMGYNCDFLMDDFLDG